MAQRLFHYQQQPQVQVGIPQATAAPPQVESSGSKVLKMALDAGARGLEFVARDFNRYQTGLIEDSLANVDRQFEEWKSEYTRTTQGKDASLAQRDFTRKYEELTQEALKNYDAPDHTIYREELQKKLAARGLMAFKDGGAYQRQQTQAWEKSVWEGGIAQLQQDIAVHADDPDRLEFLANEKLELWRQQNPGLDDSAIRLNLTRMVEEGRINAYLANEEYDKAQSVLGGGPAPTPAAGIGGAANTESMPQNVNSLIRAAAKKHGVPEDLALAVAMQESGGNQASVSHAGAIGVMQLMPGTARDLGVNPHDLAQNIDGGVRYIAQMLKEQGGDVKRALLAYNWGNGNVASWKKTGKGAKGQTMPREAQEYAARVLGRMSGATGGPMPETLPANQAIDPVKRMQFQAKIDAARRQSLEAGKSQATLQFADYKAQCLEGIIPDAPPNPENFAVFGKEATAKYFEAQAHYEYGAFFQALKEAPIQAHTQLIERMRPQEGVAGYAEKRQMWEKYKAQADQISQALEKDPLKWLAANDSKVREAREAFFANPQGFTSEAFGAYYQTSQAAQRARGVLKPQIFSKEDAQFLGEKYAAMRDPTVATQEFQRAFGAIHSKAMQEIMPHMPAAAAFMASGMNPNSAKLLMSINTEMKNDKQFLPNLYENLNLRGKDKTDFQAKIAEVAAPAAASFVGGTSDKFATATRQETEKLALAYMRRGYDKDAAIAKAFNDVIGERYIFTANPNAKALTVRIPANQPSGEITGGLKAYLNQADLKGFYLANAPHMDSEEERKAFEDMLRSQGYFVTNSDESGCFMYVGQSPVVDRQGNLIRIPWEAFAEMSRKSKLVDPVEEPEAAPFLIR